MNNSAQLSPIGAILLIFCVVIMGLMAWFLSLPPSCDPDCRIQLIGTLSGFERNSSKWNVQIDNYTYCFEYLDKAYLQNFISKNVTLTCCERQIDSRSIYSLLSCYLTGEV